MSTQIKAALASFFESAQGTECGCENQGAKLSAIQGAENLLSASIDALFGVQSGQGMESQSFVILFMNNAFVRVDYYIYCYNISAQKWGAEVNRSGCCYVADLAVLDMADLTPSEIDFLVSQALAVGDGDFERLMQIKVQLIEVAILSRALKRTELSFRELARITLQLEKAQTTISKVFNDMENYDHSKCEVRQVKMNGNARRRLSWQW